MRTVTIIQARMGSRRFPGKVFVDIGGKSMIEHVVERVRIIPGSDTAALTIPATGEEGSLALFARRQKLPVFANQIALGSCNDLLGAYLETAKALHAQVIVRVTADCPFLDPYLCGRVLHRVTSGMARFASNARPTRTFPDGLDVEAFTIDLLEEAAQSDDPLCREHVTWGMADLAWHNRRDAKRGAVLYREDKSAVRWTVDTPEDVLIMRAIAQHLPLRTYDWSATLRAARLAGVG